MAGPAADEKKVAFPQSASAPRWQGPRLGYPHGCPVRFARAGVGTRSWKTVSEFVFPGRLPN
jgi:hypothetical protein